MPQFDELGPQVRCSQVKKYLPLIDEHLPVYEEGGIDPSRFFWTILNTLDSDMVQKFSDYSQIQRHKSSKRTEGVELTEEFYSQIMMYDIRAAKKDKAISMFGSTDLGAINLKRKRKFIPLNLEDQNDEEEEELVPKHQIKRKKIGDYILQEDMAVDEPRKLRRKD